MKPMRDTDTSRWSERCFGRHSLIAAGLVLATAALTFAGTGPNPACPADLNGDGVVNGGDLGVLLGGWGGPGPGNLDGGGVVDGADLGILLGAWGPCPTFAECPGDGNCYDSHGGVGCDDEACCNAVCSIDAFCCDVAWDSLCAGAAFELCGNCGGADAGDCCALNNGSPGCNFAPCCEKICQIDPFCCNVVWDNLCVGQAADFCNICGGINACFEATGDCCEAHDTTGCSDPDCCNAVCDADPFCCDTQWDGLCADQAKFEFCNDLCFPECPGDGSCYESNGSPGCSNEACCKAVCDVDAFCCDVEWDSLCASQAFEICGNCGGADAGDCCAPNGSPGCNFAPCCEKICQIDPFCCNVEWDGICAGAAQSLCNTCGGFNVCFDATGDCCTAHGTPGCDEPFCCAAVCEADPFCCNTEWDSLCADAADDLCSCP